MVHQRLLSSGTCYDGRSEQFCSRALHGGTLKFNPNCCVRSLLLNHFRKTPFSETAKGMWKDLTCTAVLGLRLASDAVGGCFFTLANSRSPRTFSSAPRAVQRIGRTARRCCRMWLRRRGLGSLPAKAENGHGLGAPFPDW